MSWRRANSSYSAAPWPRPSASGPSMPPRGARGPVCGRPARASATASGGIGQCARACGRTTLAAGSLRRRPGARLDDRCERQAAARARGVQRGRRRRGLPERAHSSGAATAAVTRLHCRVRRFFSSSACTRARGSRTVPVFAATRLSERVTWRPVRNPRHARRRRPRRFAGVPAPAAKVFAGRMQLSAARAAGGARLAVAWASGCTPRGLRAGAGPARVPRAPARGVT